MAEENKNLKIEGEINSKLSGDTLKNALSFVAYLRANGMTTQTRYFTGF